MWLEIEVLLTGNTINWKELGFDVRHEFARRMIRLDDICHLQELLPDIQIMHFNDDTAVYIRGEYEQIRDEILHLQEGQDDED
jgi:hypothetical protein